MNRVVVVGGSLAGLRAVEALRRRDYPGAITWIGAEPHAPYDRPPLSKQVLLGSWEPERSRFRQKDGLGPLDVDFRAGVRAVGLDPATRRVLLDEGEPVTYGGLVIATGGEARMLPGSMPAGVHPLRTLDDAIAIRAALERRPRVAVVGAGFIGLEVASCCRQLGLDVTVVEGLPVPLSGAIGPQLGERVAALHRERGVDLRTGVSVERLLGQPRVRALALSDGSEVEADLVVVGIGVRPAVGWLQDSGVELGDGVVCDERCATSLPDVVAAGDVASWFNPLFGERMRVEHWTHSVEMANAAVARLLEGPGCAPFASVPYFWSDQYDVKIQFAGRVRADDSLHVVQGSLEEPKFTVLYGRQGRITGVLGFNTPAQVMKYRRQIAEGAALPA